MANPSAPNGDGAATDAMRRDAETVKQTAREDFDEIKDRAREDFETVKREARSEFDHVRREAGSYAESQKNYAAEQLAGLASVFERVGNEMRSGEQSWAGRYAGDIAHRIEDVADRARNSSLNEIVGDVENFGRQRPGAFLATAALLGFAASRFLSASASRRPQSRYADGGDPYYGGPQSSRQVGNRSLGSNNGEDL